MTGARFYAKQRERARLAAIRESTADAVNAAVGKRWLDEGADAPEVEAPAPCPACKGECHCTDMGATMACLTHAGCPCHDNCRACRGTGRA